MAQQDFLNKVKLVRYIIADDVKTPHSLAIKAQIFTKLPILTVEIMSAWFPKVSHSALLTSMLLAWAWPRPCSTLLLRPSAPLTGVLGAVRLLPGPPLPRLLGLMA